LADIDGFVNARGSKHTHPSQLGIRVCGGQVAVAVAVAERAGAKSSVEFYQPVERVNLGRGRRSVVGGRLHAIRWCE